MKITLCALASGLALAFSGAAAFADTGTTVQNGFNNDASIVQAYNSSASAILTQNGALNVANSHQRRTSHSSIDSTQNGYNNTVNATQAKTFKVSSHVEQNGALNVAGTPQTKAAFPRTSVEERQSGGEGKRGAGRFNE